MECCDPAAPGGSDDAGPEEHRDWLRIGVGALFAGNTMVVGLAVNLSEMLWNLRLFLEIALLGATVIVFQLLGGRLWRSVRQAVSERTLTFELLFLAGIVGAVGASVVSMIRGSGPIYFEVASLLLVIYALGDKVGARSRRRGLAAARNWEPAAEICRLRGPDGALRQVPLSAVRPGDTVVVDPGETLAVDGHIVEGAAFVGDAHVTGEFFSEVKRPGDAVRAGSEVLDARLTVEVQAGVGDRMVDAIRESVERAWERPSQWQREADRVVQWFLPAVIAATAATFGLWTWWGGWEAGLFNALSVLLIACPCALGFAVPLAVWMTLGKYADRGLVPRSGQVVERLAAADVAVFDKTGTLTEAAGRLTDVVVDESSARGLGRGGVLAAVGALESTSDHPVGRALHGLGDRADDDRDSPPAFHPVDARAIPGVGIRGRVRRQAKRGPDGSLDAGLAAPRGADFELAVGTDALLDDQQRTGWEALRDELHAPPAARHLVVLLEGRPVAAIAIEENPYTGVDAMLADFAAMHIDTVLLTGDGPERARRLGFDDVRALLDPQQKETVVHEMSRAGQTVVFVGDGVNDAAAMAAAEVGVAAADGSSLTVETADLTWHGRDPSVLPGAIRRARRATAVIRSNLAWAVVYNLAGIAVAAAGWLHPVAAAVLMVSSSLAVTWRTVWALEDRG